MMVDPTAVRDAVGLMVAWEDEELRSQIIEPYTEDAGPLIEGLVVLGSAMGGQVAKYEGRDFKEFLQSFALQLAAREDE